MSKDSFSCFTTKLTHNVSSTSIAVGGGIGPPTGDYDSMQSLSPLRTS